MTGQFHPMPQPVFDDVENVASHFAARSKNACKSVLLSEAVAEPEHAQILRDPDSELVEGLEHPESAPVADHEQR